MDEFYSHSWMNALSTHGWMVFEFMDEIYICLAWWGKSDEYGERRWHTNGNAKCFFLCYIVGD